MLVASEASWQGGRMDRLAVIATESQRFADVLADVDPHRRCPTCPDWTAADLLWHLVEVHHFWGAILARNTLSENDLPDIEAGKPARPASVAELLALREQATDRLVDQLAVHDDAQPLWSWWPTDQTVGFTRRMQTYEATMHRVDAELAAGLPITPLAADVAAGALDHAVDVMWGWLPDGAEYQPSAVVELVATDTGQRWLVEVGRWSAPDGSSSGPRAVRATSDPTATVTGPVADLALWAWTRGGRVATSGDGAAIDAFESVVTRGM